MRTDVLFLKSNTNKLWAFWKIDISIIIVVIVIVNQSIKTNSWQLRQKHFLNPSIPISLWNKLKVHSNAITSANKSDLYKLLNLFSNLLFNK